MTKKITFLIAAAVMLLTMIVSPGRAVGQTKGDITWTASEQGYTNQQVITSVTFDSNVSGSFNKGTNNNAPKYYTSGTAIRCYGGNYFTISSSSTLTAITISFGSSDGSNAITTDVGTYNNGSWTGSANSVTFTIGGTTGNRRIAGFSITYSSGGTPTVVTPAITPNGGNFITSQEVSISCTTEDVTIYYTLNGNDPTVNSTQYTSPFTITETTTVKAFAVKNGYNNSNIATAEFTKATAMTIAEVRAQQTGDVFTTGIVTSCVGTTGYIQDATAAICVYGASLTVGNEISVSGSLQDYNGLLEITSPQVAVISSGNVVDPEVMTVAEAVSSTNQGWYIRIENATVTAINGSNTTIKQEGNTTIVVRGISGVEVGVNDIISLNGNIGYYNANQIANPQNVTVQEPTEPTITLSSYAINAPVEGADGVLTVTYENITDVAAEVWFCNAAGDDDATYDWVTVEINTDNNVEYLVEDNDGAARTAYFKVWAYDDDLQEVYSNLVTINQDEYVAPTYAELPFSFNGGRADIENTDGLSQEGLGSDYGSSPKLKFDGTGDWLLLQFQERPGTLTFKIKGNSYSSGSTSTFKVQTSADGTNYTDLTTYTELGDTHTESFDNLDANVRYIKWIYTEKGASSGGNVALGDINLAKYEAPVASITVDPTSVEVDADEHEGTISVTYTNITDITAEVYFCDVNGDAATYNWILAEINTDNDVYYTIEANNGEARTAYLKVYALDDQAQDVYSNLVTINQAAAPQNYSLTVEPFENLELITFVDDQMELEGDGNIQVTSGAQVMLSVVANDGYVIETLMVNGVDHANNIEANHTYSFEMPSENVTISATAVEYIPPVGGNYIRINDISYLTDGAKVIIAARYDEDNTNKYYAMNNATSGKPSGVEFTSTTANTFEVLPSDITDDEDDYYWTVGITENGYTFTNANGQLIGYNSGTNFATGGNNTEWNIVFGASDASAMVANYEAFTITNHNNSGRGFALNSSHNFGPYATSNYNSSDYNFYLDFFVLGAEPVVNPSITINPGPYNMNCDGGHAVLDVAYANMAQNPQLEVIFYESDGTTAATYNHDWIDAHIDNDGNLDGTIQLNTSNEIRSAYFKIKGVGNNSELVYSDLVTINQAAYALSIVFETTELNIEVGGEQNRVLSFEYQGFGQNPAFEVRQYDATGQTQTTYEWLTTTITQGHKVNITVAANTGSARSGYFKVYGTDGTVNTESNLVTINQAEYIAPTYTVTYAANGGTGTMTDPNSPYVAGVEVTLLANTFIAPEGKIWNSWEVKDADNQDVTVNEGKFTMPASNVTVTAQWVDDPYAPTYEWVLTALEDLTSSDVFVIVGTRDNTNYYGMSTDKGTSTQPEAVEVTIANNKLSASPADRIKWNLTGDNSTGYIFYPNGSSTTWLYCNTTATSGSNTNMRVGTGDRKLFVLDNDNYLVTNDENTARYVSLNGSTDWRGYVNTNQATTITFYKRQVASTDPQLSANDVNIASDATAGEITFTLQNPVLGGELTAAITAGNEDNWLTLGNVGETTVSFTCEANTEQTERTATVTLTYTYNETSISATAVVTQAALIVDYATMPFAFDGGRDNIENTNGLTQEGLDTDYNASPKLKFKTAGTYVILKLNEAPVSLSYDIKGNGSGSDPWAGTFKVQTSADGVDYTDLVAHTELGATQSITHINLATTVRYIKWIYTTKTSGNVALGNIHASTDYDIYGDMTINSDALAAHPVIVHNGSVVTYEGTNTNAADLIIEDGGQLIHTEDVNATLQKEITAWTTKDVGGWYFIASPVNGAAIDESFDQTAIDLFKYDEPDAYWYSYLDNGHNLHPFSTLTRGVGYLHASESQQTLNFAGMMVRTDEPFSLPLSYACTYDDVKGFNLVGNPYTCNIMSGNMLIGSTPVLPIYVINDEGRTKLTAVTTDTYAIKPGEGFFVQATATNQTLTINPTAKDNFEFRYIKIVAGNENGYDNAFIQLEQGNTLRKMDIAETTSVYVMNDGDDYAAARVEELAGTMPVHFKAVEDGEFTITINAKNIEASTMMLFDNQTGELIDLLETPTYAFKASAEDDDNRFKLIFDFNNNYNGVDDNYVNGNFAYQNGDELFVSGDGTLQVFDVMGRFVMSKEIHGSESVSVSAFNTGVYMLRFVGENIMTQKIVVR